MQNSTHLLMIQPAGFGFNVQTAVNNSFQKNTGKDLQQQALAEFNNLVTLLRKHQIDVTVVEDSLLPATPDAVFPNNWISFHHDGRIYLYPMFALNRRQERKPAVLDAIKAKFRVSEIIDLSCFEADDLFLEGTGSMVLDRENKIAYACLSARTHARVLDEFCRQAGFTAISFRATDSTGSDIYHTNVMMCVAQTFAVVCLQAIADAEERSRLLASLTATGKAIIDISFEQLDHFAGNMLQVKNEVGKLFLLMSTQAYRSLNPAQVTQIEQYCSILHTAIDSIEMAGGGSVRCMLAEVFLERQ